jgi:hypothetical protein
MMEVISFGFGHSNTAVGFGSTVTGGFGVTMKGLRGAAAGLPVVLLVTVVVDTFRFVAGGVEPLAATVLVVGANLAGDAGFVLAVVLVVAVTFALAVVLAVAVAFAVAAAFAATTVAAALAASDAFAVSVGFAATTGFDTDFRTGTVFPLAADFTVTVATTFDLPFPLVLAVALFTGARRETVLEPAREALAEVTFGIDGHSNETTHKTRIAAR